MAGRFGSSWGWALEILWMVTLSSGSSNLLLFVAGELSVSLDKFGEVHLECGYRLIAIRVDPDALRFLVVDTMLEKYLK